MTVCQINSDKKKLHITKERYEKMFRVTDTNRNRKCFFSDKKIMLYITAKKCFELKLCQLALHLLFVLTNFLILLFMARDMTT